MLTLKIFFQKVPVLNIQVSQTLIIPIYVCAQARGEGGSCDTISFRTLLLS